MAPNVINAEAIANEILSSDALRNIIQGVIQDSLGPIARQFEALDARITSLSKKVEYLAPSPMTTRKTATPARQQIPHPDYFDGTNRALFQPWKTAMLAKLHLEGPILGDKKAQFYYVHNRLKDKALQIVTTYMDQANSMGEYDPMGLIDYLGTVYDDPYKKEKAYRQLKMLRQSKNASFARFLPTFEKLLAEAGGLSWGDDVKISTLFNTLHPSIINTLFAADMPTTFPEYVNKIAKVAANMENARNSQQARDRVGRASSSNHAPAVDPNAIDWEPSVNTTSMQEENKALRGKRAKWVTKEELAKRKEHRCLRCSRKRL